MKHERHTPEQIIRKRRTAEQFLNQGQTVADLPQSLAVLGECLVTRPYGIPQSCPASP
jgi:hypothetical protein